MNLNDIIIYFKNESKIDYANFQKKLIDTKASIIGVKVGVIKTLAKEELEHADEIIASIIDNEYLELDYLKGLLISYKKEPINEKLAKLEKFSAHIDNWAVCDTVVTSTKFKTKELDFLYNWTLRMLKKENTFEKRVAIIMLLKYFVKSPQNQIFEKIIKCDFGKYYFDMAVSWYYATALVYDFDNVLNLLVKLRQKSEFVYQKSLQKAIESKRISYEQKIILRKYKKEMIKC